FACVNAQTRLIDVAAQFGSADAIGVIDETGRLVGRLEAGQVLARIGATAQQSAHQGTHGVRHV
ncbi:MAG TPA: hypothetical protein VGC41_20775, partial [Kofleriaceae bacterium]